MRLYPFFETAKKERQPKFAVLIDPDKIEHLEQLQTLLDASKNAKVDFILIGGSLIVNDYLDTIIQHIKTHTQTPVILFPGSSRQLSYRADAILFLSLISGRNPDLLIGKHVETAPFLKRSPLEVLPTGYMLIDGGVPTSVSYMSNTNPIPANKSDIAVCTALAGELLGLRLIYMDAGSGAANPIPAAMIRAVSQNLEIPLIVGGGIRTPEQAALAVEAGADVVVVGNALEKNPGLIPEIAKIIHSYNPR